MTYLRPIINGAGNFYIEAQTNDGKRSDLIVDYLGKQFLIELKIYYGKKYIIKGIEQLVEYLNKFDLDVGYLLIFNFNKNKKTEITRFKSGGKTIIQAIA